MSKIVCDICGATYPDTDDQCPICGTAKADAAAAGDTAAEAGGYAYVKGGRFSKSNVKKRNNGQRELPRETVQEKPQKEKPVKEKPVKEKPAKAPKQTPVVRRERPQRQQEQDEPTGNLGLIIIVVILVLAIVAVSIFIIMRYVDQLNPEGPAGSTPATSTPAADPTGSTGNQGPISIPCTGLRLPLTEYTFNSVGEVLLLKPEVQPENTTEGLLFISEDPRIATVDQKGMVTAVADGETVIYVACGSWKVQITIICNVGVAPTDPTEPTQPTQPSEPAYVLELNRTDFTLNGYGASHQLYSGPIDRTAIKWTSSNEDVATVKDGKVTAVGNGKATITAEYEGQTATCIVRCSNVTVASFTLNTTDFTITVGKSFTVKAYDAEGLRIDPSELKFYTAKEGFFTVDETGKVTGVQSNYGYKTDYLILYVEYKGEVLKCIVRVSAAE